MQARALIERIRENCKSGEYEKLPNGPKLMMLDFDELNEAVALMEENMLQLAEYLDDCRSEI